MYCIVETQQQLDLLSNKKMDEVFLHSIEGNFNYHPIYNTVVGVYIRDIYENKGYILSINHNDCNGLDIYNVYNFLNSLKTIYVLNYKKFLYSFNLPKPKIIDIHENTHSELNFEYTPLINNFYKIHYKNININSIIPILKLYEWCEINFKSIKQYCHNDHKYIFNDISKVFYLIELNGLPIKEPLSEQFKLKNPEYCICDNRIYSNFNLYTQTGRPSNSFNGFNFMAIDKKNGIRENFIPSNNMLVEIDFTAYHPILLSQLCNHEFQTTPYQDFSNAFNLELEDAKKIMFLNIYGGIQDKYMNFTFFQKIDLLAEDLFEKYNEGTLKSPSGYSFNKTEYTNLTKYKLLNYYIQNYETYNNIKILKKLLKITSNTKTKIIHYTYDSILFDFSKEDTELLEDICNIIEEFKLMFKIYKGKNYNQMQKFYEFQH